MFRGRHAFGTGAAGVELDSCAMGFTMRANRMRWGFAPFRRFAE